MNSSLGRRLCRLALSQRWQILTLRPSYEPCTSSLQCCPSPRPQSPANRELGPFARFGASLAPSFIDASPPCPTVPSLVVWPSDVWPARWLCTGTHPRAACDAVCPGAQRALDGVATPSPPSSEEQPSGPTQLVSRLALLRSSLLDRCMRIPFVCECAHRGSCLYVGV